MQERSRSRSRRSRPVVNTGDLQRARKFTTCRADLNRSFRSIIRASSKPRYRSDPPSLPPRRVHCPSPIGEEPTRSRASPNTLTPLWANSRNLGGFACLLDTVTNGALEVTLNRQLGVEKFVRRGRLCRERVIANLHASQRRATRRASSTLN